MPANGMTMEGFSGLVVTLVGCSAKHLGHKGCPQEVDLWDQILYFLELFSKCISEKMCSLNRLGKHAVRICSTMGSNNAPIQGDVGKNDLSVISVARRALWIQLLLLLRWDTYWKRSAGPNDNFKKKKKLMESQPDRIWLSKQ